jgi:hypothetical protein
MFGEKRPYFILNTQAYKTILAVKKVAIIDNESKTASK